MVCLSQAFDRISLHPSQTTSNPSHMAAPCPGVLFGVPLTPLCFMPILCCEELLSSELRTDQLARVPQLSMRLVESLKGLPRVGAEVLVGVDQS